jgi:hypothetical protein
MGSEVGLLSTRGGSGILYYNILSTNKLRVDPKMLALASQKIARLLAPAGGNNIPRYLPCRHKL